MNNQDHISEGLEINFWVKILKFFNVDPGWKKFVTGIRDKHSGSATLPYSNYLLCVCRGVGWGFRGKDISDPCDTSAKFNFEV
jgi:hypothetical protein